MIKFLPISLFAIVTFASVTEARTITYTSDELGEITAVSSNGEYASVYDYENNKAYLWTRATGNFTEISAPRGTSDQPSGQRISGTWAMGVADDGTVVGCVQCADGRQYPSIYKDGTWTRLPIHGGAINYNTAVSITADCKVIGGYQFINDPSSSIKGRFYPCRWTLNPDGSYEMHAYTDIKLPDHQGFYVTSMSPDGSVLAGTVYAGVASTLPAFITADGELTIPAKIEEKSEPWMFAGKYYCGVDENGNQIWSKDPEDPRIVYFTETYIDGVKDDGESSFSGGFQSVDARGNFYGMRTVATNVSDGTGTLRSCATVYNRNTGEWSDNFSYQAFTNGVGKYVFGLGDVLLIDGTPSSFTSAFDFTFPRMADAMYKASADGRIIGGNVCEYNPATGEPQYFPFIIELENSLLDLSGVEGIEAGTSVQISVVSGTIEVAGASDVAVYDVNGRLVSTSASTSVQPGLYVVRADGKASKVLVQ